MSRPIVFLADDRARFKLILGIFFASVGAVIRNKTCFGFGRIEDSVPIAMSRCEV